MKLGLGTVQFGLPYGISNKSGQVEADEVSKILQIASASGMQILDTAAGYGSSEAVLGSSLAQEQGFLVVTKTPPLKTDRVRQEDVLKAKAAFDNSLRNLGQCSVYGLLVHHSVDLLSPGGDLLYQTLQQWKDEGRVKKIGVSVYDKEEVDRLFDKFSFDIVQLPLNVFDQRLIRNGTLGRLHAAGIEVHVRSAFLQGLLLMPTHALPPYFSGLKSRHEAYIAALGQAGLSPLAGALGYFHNRPEVATVLVGVENHLQLQECLFASKDLTSFDFGSFAVDDPLMLDPRVWC